MLPRMEACHHYLQRFINRTKGWVVANLVTIVCVFFLLGRQGWKRKQKWQAVYDFIIELEVLSCFPALQNIWMWIKQGYQQSCARSLICSRTWHSQQFNFPALCKLVFFSGWTPHENSLQVLALIILFYLAPMLFLVLCWFSII